MPDLSPLAMSGTKDELLKRLEMSQETYTLMAKETDRVYKWLTSEKQHLKANCKRKPPYDWSDILERSKDEAMQRIAAGGSDHTRYYWNQASEITDCPNWIARWFLYHKFRYRDRRNRNPAREEGRHSNSHYRSRRHRHEHEQGEEASGSQDYYPSEGESSCYSTGHSLSTPDPPYYYSTTTTSNSYNLSSRGGSTSTSYTPYESSSAYQVSYHQDEDEDPEQGTSSYYDPIRDTTRPS